MTNEDFIVASILKLISDLPSDEQDACHELAEHIRIMRDSAGPGVGSLAVALVGAEMHRDNP